MTPSTTKQALVPPPGQALVVFVRPGELLSTDKLTLLTGSGHFLGDSLPESHFASALPPGQHLFVCWAETTGVVQATLLPDRVYYVEVVPLPGNASARCDLLALSPRSPKWSGLVGWLSQTRQLVPAVGPGQSYISSRWPEAQARVQAARDQLSRLTPAQLAERTLQPQDGAAATP